MCSGFDAKSGDQVTEATVNGFVVQKLAGLKWQKKQ